MLCPICNGTILNGHYQLYDDRYGYPGKFTTLFCTECGHGTLDCNLTDQEIEKLYTNYYPRLLFDIDKHGPRKASNSKLISWLNGEFANAYRWVPENLRVLDIGCGFGEAMGYHAQRGCEVWGVEADSNAKIAAEKYNYSIHIGVFNKTNYKKEYFDYITMDQVIEHVRDPIKNINDISDILKPNGVIIVSTPNHNSLTAKLLRKKWLHWHVPYHLHFLTRESIKNLAAKTGHELVACHTITNYAWLVMQLMHLLNYPKAGQVSSYWKDHLVLGKPLEQNKIPVFIIKILNKCKIIHVINKILDVCGMGDNFIFLLKKITSKNV